MSTEQNEIWDILVKSLTGEITAQEQQHLDNWLNLSALNRHSYKTFLKLKFRVSLNSIEQYKEQVFANIINRIENKRKASRILRFVSTAAASLALLISTAIVFYQIGQQNLNNQLVEVFTPRGVKSKVFLPDGSLVMLNSNSKITYPSRFSNATREVKFEGEGFFTVSKDQKHPFVVRTSTVKVRVTGTRFNLKSYIDDHLVETTLEEGAVNVTDTKGKNREIKLLPGHQAIFNKDSDVFRIVKVEPLQISSWQEGKYYFKSKSFEDIGRELERAFDVTIEIRSQKLKNEVFSGEFIRGESLDQIFAVMQKNTGFTYIKTEQHIIITEK